MSAQIAWVFGPSGVGKKTLMFEAANTNVDGRVRKLLGVHRNTPIIPVVIPNRVKRKPEHVVTGSIFRRHLMLAELYNITTYPQFADSVWLVHGQTVDFRHDILNKLKNKHPDRFDYAIYIDLKPDVFNARRKKRGLRISYERAYESRDYYLEQLRQIFDNVLIISE